MRREPNYAEIQRAMIKLKTKLGEQSPVLPPESGTRAIAQSCKSPSSSRLPLSSSSPGCRVSDRHVVERSAQQY
jgi:hypothetical protein